MVVVWTYIMLLMAGARIMADHRRIAALEARPAFHGYLYTLNESGTWDRVRSNDLEACRYPRRCSVMFFECPPGSVCAEGKK